MLTTTGFASADFDKWPEFTKTVLFILMFIGGSAGSTAGGIKVVRIVIFFKHYINELKYLIYPNGIFTLHFNGLPVKKSIIYPMAGFLFVYMLIALISTLIISFFGFDILTSFSASLSCLGSIGPGFNLVGPTLNYSIFPDSLLVFLGFLMLLGRLEIFTVLLLFRPLFWKR